MRGGGVGGVGGNGATIDDGARMHPLLRSHQQLLSALLS